MTRDWQEFWPFTSHYSPLTGYHRGMVTAALETPEREIYSPSRLNREARVLLERGLPALWLAGEISNLSRPSSGHWYFSLKDDAAQLRCAMFRQRNLLAQFAPKDGMHVLARGRVSLYEPRGDYQFIVDYIEDGGEGALRRRFELLRTKLAADGLFTVERKRPLPRIPRRIGVVTSPTGAAIRDILYILKRRFPLASVCLYPVSVQGAQAAGEIAAAIRRASNRSDCDVLIVARGGGSLEDLWAFNEEVVARAVFDCRIPIVTGIGHETDFTIADFVADVRAPTPSGAAEVVAPDAREWLQHFVRAEERILTCLKRRMNETREHADWLRRRLLQLHPGIALRQRAQRIDELEQCLRRALLHRLAELRAKLMEQSVHLRRHSPALKLSAARGRIERAELLLGRAMSTRIENARGRCALAARALNAMSPLATLQRGYAIVTDAAGMVVTNSENVAPGARIVARLARGRLHARVESSETDEK